MRRPVPTDARTRARFEEHAGPPQANGCRIWTGPTKPNGYGYLEVEGRNVYAHRIGFALTHGQPTANVLHHCDTPGCVAEWCLFDGTQKDNMDDAARKGRTVPPPRHRGERHPQATLSDEQVEKVRRARGRQRDVARRFGVSQSTVSRIKLGQTRCPA